MIKPGSARGSPCLRSICDITALDEWYGTPLEHAPHLTVQTMLSNSLCNMPLHERQSFVLRRKTPFRLPCNCARLWWREDRFACSKYGCISDLTPFSRCLEYLSLLCSAYTSRSFLPTFLLMLRISVSVQEITQMSQQIQIQVLVTHQLLSYVSSLV